MYTHTCFTVKVALHERTPEETARRIRQAAEKLGAVGAYFRYKEGAPFQAGDGTFELHAPSSRTLYAIPQMLENEGLEIVKQEEVPGTGIIAVAPQ
jgi:hypothetical protein